MILNEISTGVFDSKLLIKSLNLRSNLINELFLRNLPPEFLKNKPKKIVVELLDSNRESKIWNNLNVKIVGVNFDFKKYKSLISEYEKRLFILNALKVGLEVLAIENKWNLNHIEEAYQKCLAVKIENKQHIIEPKLSPDRKFKAAIYCEHEAEYYKIFVDFFDFKNRFTKRVLIVETKPNHFYFYPVLGKTKWQDSNTFCLFSRNGKKSWCANVNEEVRMPQARQDGVK